MKVHDIRTQLEDYGELKVKPVSRNQIPFYLSGTIDTVQELESLVRVVDNIPTAELTVSGNHSGDALIIVRVDYAEFDMVPPYLQ